MPPDSTLNEFRESFLQDETGFFKKITALAEGEFSNEPKEIAEFFRIAHTIKGNATALGFKSIEEHAHHLEDLLHQFEESSRRKISIEAVKLRRAYLLEKRALIEAKATPPEPTLPKEPQDSFFLSATIEGKKVLISCDTIAEVVRDPQVMSVPSPGASNWLGIIAWRGNLVPLVRLGLHNATKWVIILKSMFSFPVEEIGGVTTMLSQSKDITIMDTSKL